MNSKYLFIFSHDRQIEWYSVFARGFKDFGETYKTAIFVHGKEDAKKASLCGCYDKIYDVLNCFNYDKNLSIEQVAIHDEVLQLENKLSTSFFWEDIKTDRWSRAKNDASFMIQYFNHTIQVMLEAYSELNPVAALGEYTMAFYRFAHRYFQSNGKPMLYPITTRYYERLYFETCLFWEWDACQKLYNKYLRDGIPEDIKSEVMPYFEKITTKYSRPNYTGYQSKFKVGFTEIDKLPWKTIAQKVVRALRPIKRAEMELNVRNSIVETGIAQKIKRLIKERRNFFKYKLASNKDVPQGVRYAIYFMHYQPEYTSDNLGKYYIDQQFLIGNIASSLPADMLLLVKEHPTMIGLRDESIYDHIIKNNNVVLIKHTVDSIELIKSAEIVFTIVGTPALEAMFIGKPAIMFGRYAFANTNLISLCTDIWQLEKMVREKVGGRVSSEETARHALALLAAKFKASKPGLIPIAAELIDAFLNNKQNFNLVKQSFMEELQERDLAQ